MFDISDNTKFKPSFLVKATNGAPLSYDLTANFLFNEKFWLGAAYRVNESAGAFGALIDFQVSKQFVMVTVWAIKLMPRKRYQGDVAKSTIVRRAVFLSYKAQARR